MPATQYRTWEPPGGVLRIEYSAQLIQAVRLGGGETDHAGVLFGRKRNNDLQVTSIRQTDGTEPVGIFLSRARGEVFLTESDLQLLEATAIADGVALVVAGSRAGFFLREPDGSMQTIQSRLEFSIEPAAVVRKRRRANPLAVALGCLGIATVPLLARIVKPPLVLSVWVEAGQVRIAWEPIGGRLDIRDGLERISIPVSAMLSSVTYEPHTRDVEVVLIGRDRRKSVRVR